MSYVLPLYSCNHRLAISQPAEPRAKVQQRTRLGPRLNLINSFRHFAHPSPNFKGVEWKVQNLASILEPSRFWRTCFRNGITYLKSQTCIGITDDWPLSGANRFTQLWEVSVRISWKTDREICWIINNSAASACPISLRFGRLVRNVSAEHDALYCIVLYSFIVQVDRTQLILHTNSFPYIVYL